MCLGYFHGNVPPLDKENTLDPVMDFAQRNHHWPCWRGFSFPTTSEELEVSKHKPLKVCWAHSAYRWRCFPNCLSIKAQNSITSGSEQSGFVRDCVIGKPIAVEEMLDHSECLCTSSWESPMLCSKLKESRRKSIRGRWFRRTSISSHAAFLQY